MYGLLQNTHIGRDYNKIFTKYLEGSLNNKTNIVHNYKVTALATGIPSWYPNRKSSAPQRPNIILTTVGADA